MGVDLELAFLGADEAIDRACTELSILGAALNEFADTGRAICSRRRDERVMVQVSKGLTKMLASEGC